MEKHLITCDLYKTSNDIAVPYHLVLESRLTIINLDTLEQENSDFLVELLTQTKYLNYSNMYKIKTYYKKKGSKLDSDLRLIKTLDLLVGYYKL